MKKPIERLLEGSVDFHVHVGPDAYRSRIADAQEIALQTKKNGMKGVVLKSHDYPTAPMAHLAKKNVEDTEIIGSLSLNDGVGGINPHAVEVSAKTGARVVWMPTTSSLNHRRAKGRAEGIFILGKDGEILPEIREVLALIKEYDLVLCTGHLSQEEIAALFVAAQNMAITKFVVTHPFSGVGKSLNSKVQRELAEKGAFLEYCFLAIFHGVSPQKIARVIRSVGVERCLLSTDFGQLDNPPPWEGMRMMLDTFLQCDFSEKEVSILVKENPYQLLNL